MKNYICGSFALIGETLSIKLFLFSSREKNGQVGKEKS